MNGIAFFDMDRTILSINSASLWVRAERREGRIQRRELLVAFGWIARYQLGFARMEEALRAAVGTLEGDLEEEVEARTRAFWDRELAHQIRPGAVDAVARERALGRKLVLLTSSSPYLSRPAVEQLALDDYLCNRFEVAEGRFTGRPIEPLCYGPGKRHYAEQFAEAEGVALSECSFYTDSFSDLAALEVVGQPVAVNPDPRLTRAARKRGWPIEDWGP